MTKDCSTSNQVHQLPTTGCYTAYDEVKCLMLLKIILLLKNCPEEDFTFHGPMGIFIWFVKAMTDSSALPDLRERRRTKFTSGHTKILQYKVFTCHTLALTKVLFLLHSKNGRFRAKIVNHCYLHWIILNFFCLMKSKLM